jgi:hypothetical protein
MLTIWNYNFEIPRQQTDGSASDSSESLSRNLGADDSLQLPDSLYLFPSNYTKRNSHWLSSKTWTNNNLSYLYFGTHIHVYCCILLIIFATQHYFQQVELLYRTCFGICRTSSGPVLVTSIVSCFSVNFHANRVDPPVCYTLYILYYFFLLPPLQSFVSLSFLILRQSVGLLGRGMSPSQTRYLYKQNKHRQTSMSWVGFEPTIPAFERGKTVHALDRVATVISCTSVLYCVI